MLFEIKITRSYVVFEEARARVEAASAEEVVEAFWNDMNSVPWQTTDEKPCQDTEVVCRPAQEVVADFRVVEGNLVAQK